MIDYHNIENKVLTENPLLDEIVWNIQSLARSSVLKDQDEADKYEDLESIQNGDMLLAIKSNRVQFDRFYYGKDLLSELPNISTDQIEEYANDNKKIPVELRSTLLSMACNIFLTNFVEKNNYYRKLHGVPNYYSGQAQWLGLWIDLSQMDNVIDGTYSLSTLISDRYYEHNTYDVANVTPGDRVPANRYYVDMPDRSGRKKLTTDEYFLPDRTYYTKEYELYENTAVKNIPDNTYYEYTKEDGYYLTSDNVFQYGKDYFLIVYKKVYNIGVGDRIPAGSTYYEYNSTTKEYSITTDKNFKEGKDYFLKQYNLDTSIRSINNVTDGMYYEYDPIDDQFILTTDKTFQQGKNYYYEITTGTDWVLFQDLDAGNAEILYNNGVITELLNNDSLLKSFNTNKDELQYLNHLGTKSIDYYDARKADRFELLYCGDCDSVEVENRYKDLLEVNRKVALYNLYSEAYKYRSDYYDKFIMIFIVIQTIIDMIIELPEYIIRKDIFDIRTCRYFFESFGVDYFPDIPLRYQVALVKNLNKLINFKSTDQCLVDICSIFGCKDISIFKYYILRSRNIVSTSITTPPTYYNYKDQYGDDDNDKNYELRFVKVPLLSSYDDVIRTTANIEGYNTVTGGDDYWIGNTLWSNDENWQKEAREKVESDIKDMNFTLLHSKYYSIEALIDVTKRTFTLCYFMNMLMYNHIDKSKLTMLLPNISNAKQFELVDVIILLYALSYVYYDADDTIMDTQSKVLSILGFNFNADLGAIAEHLKNMNYLELTLQDLGVATYTDESSTYYGLKLCKYESTVYKDTVQLPEYLNDKTIYAKQIQPTDKYDKMDYLIPHDRILTYKELMEIYTTNKNIYDHIKYHLAHPDSKPVYDAYKYLYESLYIMDMEMTYFKKSDGSMAKTYTDYLQDKDPLLYAYLGKIKSVTAPAKRRSAVINAIQAITLYLKDYVNEDLINYSYLFSNLPSISLDFIKDYIGEVIDFFKSFKIYTKDVSIRYLFSDAYDTGVILVEWMWMTITFDKDQHIPLQEQLQQAMHMEKSDKHEIIDKIWLDISRWVKKNLNTYYENTKYPKLTQAIRDTYATYAKFIKHETDLENMADAIVKLQINILCKDTIKTDDMIYARLYQLYKDEYINETIIDSLEKMLDTFTFRESGEVDDVMEDFIMRLRYSEDIIPYHATSDIHEYRSHTEEYRPQDNYQIIYTYSNAG